MKERPILFAGEMVRAILDGRKTQTRRVIKPQPTSQGAIMITPDGNRDYIFPVEPDEYNVFPHEHFVRCPYGKPGDHLWVRETFVSDGEYLGYRADHNTQDKNALWTPSIFMPRWASRITLEITDVRVEHLVDISDSDCYAEGIISHQDDILGEPYYSFKEYWDSINIKTGCLWNSNPWVWVIEFKKIEQ